MVKILNSHFDFSSDWIFFFNTGTPDRVYYVINAIIYTRSGIVLDTLHIFIPEKV